MSAFQSFLAVPIKACVSSDGVLLSADPPVWRLHSLAGGRENSEVAIPGLAALAATTQRTGMRIERPVRARQLHSLRIQFRKQYFWRIVSSTCG